MNLLQIRNVDFMNSIIYIHYLEQVEVDLLCICIFLLVHAHKQVFYVDDNTKQSVKFFFICRFQVRDMYAYTEQGIDISS